MRTLLSTTVHTVKWCSLIFLHSHHRRWWWYTDRVSISSAQFRLSPGFESHKTLWVFLLKGGALWKMNFPFKKKFKQCHLWCHDQGPAWNLHCIGEPALSTTFLGYQIKMNWTEPHHPGPPAPLVPLTEANQTGGPRTYTLILPLVSSVNGPIRWKFSLQESTISVHQFLKMQ